MKNRANYPKNWKQLAHACKVAAGWKCQKCGIAHGTMRYSVWTNRNWPVYLVAAHIHHDPANPHPELLAVCPSCHWHYFRRPGQRALWMISERKKHQYLIKMAYLT
jgi:hypothetical protein